VDLRDLGGNYEARDLKELFWSDVAILDDCRWMRRIAKA
jgi:hypothetical protein